MYRLAVIALILAGCGHHHHAAPTAFARIDGSWQATCTASSGDYAGIPVGTQANFTVDRSGHLVGWDSLGGTVAIDLQPNGPTGFYGSRLLSNGRTEQVFLWLTTPPTGSMNDGNGSASWSLVLLAAGG